VNHLNQVIAVFYTTNGVPNLFTHTTII